MTDPINEADFPPTLVKSVNDAAAFFGWTEEQRQDELRRQYGHWLIEAATIDAWTDEITRGFTHLDQMREIEELRQRAQVVRERMDAILEDKVALAEKYGQWERLINEERERGTLPEVIEILRAKHETLGRVLEILEDEDPTP